MYFAFSVQYSILYFNHIDLSSSLAPLGREIDICAHRLFSMKFNCEQLLFEVFLDVMRIFGIVEPQIECILQFQQAFLIMLSHSGLQCRHIAVRLTDRPNLVNCINLELT